MRVLPERRLDELLEAASKQRVVVIGDVMLDVYLTGDALRISPEAPVPVVHVTAERYALGGAANVAGNVCALGADCVLIGCTGEDIAGDQVRHALQNSHACLDARLPRIADRPTTTKTRVMARHQQVVRYDREEIADLGSEALDELIALAREAIADAGAVILEDYNKGVLAPPVIRAAIEAANAAGIPSVADPKFRHFFEYRGTTVFKPNVHELSAALGTTGLSFGDAEMKQARERIGCEHLLVTLGERGMAVHSAGGAALRIPALAREVFDVSGAGDTVSAFLAVALASGATIEEAAVFANLAAAIEVSKQGVATVTPDELREFAARNREHLAAQPTSS